SAHSTSSCFRSAADARAIRAKYSKPNRLRSTNLSRSILGGIIIPLRGRQSIGRVFSLQRHPHTFVPAFGMYFGAASVYLAAFCAYLQTVYRRLHEALWAGKTQAPVALNDRKTAT